LQFKYCHKCLRAQETNYGNSLLIQFKFTNRLYKYINLRWRFASRTHTTEFFYVPRTVREIWKNHQKNTLWQDADRKILSGIASQKNLICMTVFRQNIFFWWFYLDGSLLENFGAVRFWEASRTDRLDHLPVGCHTGKPQLGNFKKSNTQISSFNRHYKFNHSNRYIAHIGKLNLIDLNNPSSHYFSLVRVPMLTLRLLRVKHETCVRGEHVESQWIGQDKLADKMKKKVFN